MASIDNKFNVVFDASEATKKLNRAQKAAEKLLDTLKQLEDIKIGISVTDVKPKWWQFWK